MKVIPIVILIAALALGLRQARISKRLSEREQELRHRQETVESTTNSLAITPPTLTSNSPPTKTDRKTKQSFNYHAYLEELRQIASTGEFDAEVEKYIYGQLLLASPSELISLIKQLREEQIGSPFRSLVFEIVAPLLIEKNAVEAAELAVAGGEIKNFHLVMRRWIARDPTAAAEWLEAKKAGDPPLDEKSFATHASSSRPLDVESLELAAQVLNSPGSANLSHLLGQKGAELEDTVADLMAVLPAEGLPTLLKRLHQEGRNDLVEMSLMKHRDPVLAREHLKEANLPPDLFQKYATDLVLRLDPVSLEDGTSWFFGSTDSTARGDSFQKIVTYWTNQNPSSAAAWMEQLPDGPDRDVALAAYRQALENPPAKAPLVGE